MASLVEYLVPSRNCVAHIQPCCSRTISIRKMARPFDHFSTRTDETGRFRGVFPKVCFRCFETNELRDKGSCLVFLIVFWRLLVLFWGCYRIIVGVIGSRIALIGCSFRLISYVFEVSRFRPLWHFLRCLQMSAIDIRCEAFCSESKMKWSERNLDWIWIDLGLVLKRIWYIRYIPIYKIRDRNVAKYESGGAMAPA